MTRLGSFWIPACAGMTAIRARGISRISVLPDHGNFGKVAITDSGICGTKHRHSRAGGNPAQRSA